MRCTSDAAPPFVHQHRLANRITYHLFPDTSSIIPTSCPGTLPCYEAKQRANTAPIRRPLGQLFASSGTLYGEEADRLRNYCSTVYLDPDKDLKDPYGVLFEAGSLTAFQEHFQSRVKHFDGKRHEAAQELFKLKWGPNRTPVYLVLLDFTFIDPGLRYNYIKIAEWLVDTAKVPVDGMSCGMPLHRFVLLGFSTVHLDISVTRAWVATVAAWRMAWC